MHRAPAACACPLWQERQRLLQVPQSRRRDSTGCDAAVALALTLREKCYIEVSAIYWWNCTMLVRDVFAQHESGTCGAAGCQ